MTAPHVLSEVWRYPVKGLGGQRLSAAVIVPGRGIAEDRRWLLAHSPADKMLAGGEPWRPWDYALTLKKTAQLASLRAAVEGNNLIITAADGQSVGGNPQAPAERFKIEFFLRKFLQDERLSLVDCESRPAWDYPRTPITVLFAATVADLAQHTGAALAAARFRANIIIDGGVAWAETRHNGGMLSLGDKVRLSVGAGVGRCAATTVNPESGVRDINVPQTLVRHYGHNMCGIKCVVLQGGKVAAGAPVSW